MHASLVATKQSKVQGKNPQVFFRGSYTMARKPGEAILPWSELYDPMGTDEDPEWHLDDIVGSGRSARLDFDQAMSLRSCAARLSVVPPARVQRSLCLSQAPSAYTSGW